jgi:hypothetical protein
MNEYLKTVPGTQLIFKGTVNHRRKELCSVYWGSHGCHKKRYHRFNRHSCDRCAWGPLHYLGKILHLHPYCVERWPYYGKLTYFYGDDIARYGLRTFDN